MNKTIAVIYHRADFDGIFCREIARKFFGDRAVYIGWDYGDEMEPLPATVEIIYMLDISIEGWMNDPRLVWIDHHATAIAKWNDTTKGYRIDGVAACRLAWQWFAIHEHNAQNSTNEALQVPLPGKQEYVDRSVSEPWAVRLAGEYDIWDRRDPDAELFQHGLRSRDLANDWPSLLSYDQKASIAEVEALIDVGHRNILRPDGTTPNATVVGLLNAGRAVQYAKTQENSDIITAYGFEAKWEGLTFLCCNHARFNSHLFSAAIEPQHDALMGFNWTGQEWRVSLYGVPGKPDVDLSAIAKRYGGGGHKQACGFRCVNLPVLPNK